MCWLIFVVLWFWILFSLCSCGLLLSWRWLWGRLRLLFGMRMFFTWSKSAVPMWRKMFSEFWRDIVEGESVEATKAVAKIVGGVLARRSSLPSPGSRALPQPCGYIGMARCELAPRARSLFLIKRKPALKSRLVREALGNTGYSRQVSTVETSSPQRHLTHYLNNTKFYHLAIFKSNETLYTHKF